MNKKKTIIVIAVIVVIGVLWPVFVRQNKNEVSPQTTEHSTVVTQGSKSFELVQRPERGEGLTAEQLRIVSDPDTFSGPVYYMKTAGSFYKDKKYVYWIVFSEPVYDSVSSIRIVLEADPATIQADKLGFDANVFAKDKDTVFCFGFPIQGMNPQDTKLSIVNGNAYAFDKNQIWGGAEDVQLHQIPSLDLKTACHQYTQADFKTANEYQKFVADIATNTRLF